MYHPDSKHLQKFIKPIVKKYYENRENPVNISMIAKIFIEKIVGWIEDATNSYSTANIVDSPLVSLPRGSNFSIIPEEIQLYLERMDWIGNQVSFEINSRNFKIYFIHPLNESKQKVSKWLNSIKKKIYIWLYIASIESTVGCSRDLSIYMYFTDFKKELPQSGEIIGRSCVNTAFTFSCKSNESGGNEIYLYRKEEWFKVLIHESFHCFDLDFSSLDNTTLSQIDRNILKIFPLSIDVRFYETYCEVWAEILNIVCIVYENERENGIQMMTKRITEHLVLEQFFSIFQACKILRSLHISYRELYQQTEKAKYKRLTHYKEDTHVLTYYILKSIIICHFGEFLEWCTVNNKGSLNFRKTHSNLDSYTKFVGDRYKNEDLLQMFYYMDDVLNLNMRFGKLVMEKRENRESINILKNLRMSIFEMV
jgi:hypothetical protein